MAGAQTSLSLQDKLTGPLTKVMKAMDSTIKVMEQMNRSTQQLDQKSLANARKNITNASADLARLKSSMGDTSRATQHASQQQDKFNNSLGDGLSKIRNFAAGLLAAMGAYKVISSTIKGGFDRLVSIDSAQAKLSALGHTGQSVEAIMQNSLASVRGTAFGLEEAVTTAASAVAAGIKPGQGLERYLSLTADAAAIAGSSMAEMGAIFNKVTTSGMIQADELNQLSDRGIPIFQMIAKEMGVASSEIRKLASEGKISSNVFLDAVESGFGGAAAIMGESSFAAIIDNINASISRMGANFLNGAGDGQGFFDQVKPLMVDLLNTFQSFEDKVAAIGNVVGQVFMNVYNAVSAVAGAIADNWSWIAPILIVLGVVLGAIVGILMVKYTVLGLIRLATLAWAAAQWVVNAAYLANPITWVLIGIVAVIALVIYAMVAWAEQTATVVGAIVGSVYWLGAVIYNILMGVGNFAIMVAEWFVNTWNQAIFMTQVAWIGFNLFVRMVFDAIGNAVLRVAEFFINKWNDATYGVQMAFYHMQTMVLNVMSGIASGVVGVVNSALGALSTLINGAVSGLNSLIGMINNIPGVNVSTVGTVDLKIGNGASAAINNFKSSLSAPTRAPSASLGSFNTAGDYASNVNLPSAPGQTSFGRLEYKNLGEAFGKGQQAGSNLSLNASNKLTGALDKMTGIMSGSSDLVSPDGTSPGGHDPSLGGTLPGGGSGPGAAGGKGGGSNPTGGKLDSVGKINEDINIADEDLKLLLEMADRRSINEINITLNPTVKFEDTVVKEEADINGIITEINKNFEDEMARSIEGVVT